MSGVSLNIYIYILRNLKTTGEMYRRCFLGVFLAVKLGVLPAVNAGDVGMLLDRRRPAGRRLFIDYTPTCSLVDSSGHRFPCCGGHWRFLLCRDHGTTGHCNKLSSQD